MPRSLPVSLTFYPAYCFSLSPTHTTWARLTVAEVHTLKEREGFEGQNLYFYLNHPIKWIRLVGVIVAFDMFPTRWIMLLDDSSGALIEVTCARPTPISTATSSETCNVPSKIVEKPTTSLEGITATGRAIDLNGIDIGTVVKAKGGVGSFRGEKQIHLERISIVQTTNEEAAAWAENTAFRKDILNTPWVVSEKDEKQAKRKAEGLDQEKKARDDRRRRKQRVERKSELRVMEEGKRRILERKRAAAEEEEAKREEARRVAAQEGKARREETACANAEEERRDREKKRREHERRRRQQEFERLKCQEEKEPP